MEEVLRVPLDRLMGVVAALGLALGHVPARSEQILALELLLAVDVSSSVDDGEFELQKEGIVQAFQDEATLQAIMDQGGIAVAVMLWAGSDAPRPLAVEWAILSEQEAVDGFLSAVARIERPGWQQSTTGIGAAVLAAVEYVEGNGIDSFRQVIDVAADGRSNDGPMAEIGRDAAHAAGITVNGLAVLSTEPGLEDYFRRAVVTPGGFVQTAGDYSDFVRAMNAKLWLEIAGLLPPVPRMIAAAW